MTPTMATIFPIEIPSRWNVFFAEESDRDLDFDEGFEEDELQHSKPPSRRPLLWIFLLLLVGGATYWAINGSSIQMPKTAEIEFKKDATELSTPLFIEGQTVVLIEETGISMLMGDATNSQPGPMVKNGEKLTIVDGLNQITGWVYLVKTGSGKTGWISEEKLKKPRKT